VTGCDKSAQANRAQRQEGVTILPSDKADFIPKLVRRNKETHFLLIKETIQQEEVTITNIYTLNINTTNFIKQIVLDVKT
jgi:hypothetical protein